jgi:hypothetical protein
MPWDSVAKKSVPQRGSVWVDRDVMHAEPDTIHGRPTRYRVVVLTFLIWLRVTETQRAQRTRRDCSLGRY